MSNTIESLEIEVIGSSQSAEQALDALEQSLSRLKNAVKGGCGLTAVTHQLSAMNTALGSTNSSNIANLKGLADGLDALSKVGQFKLSSSVANQITNLGMATKALTGADFSQLTALASALTPLASVGKANLGSTINQLGKLPAAIQPLTTMNMGSVKDKIKDLVDALKPLSTMEKANLSSTLNQIKKLPEVFNTLNTMNMPGFKAKIKEVVDALKPLADEMQKVANGFSAFPAKIQKLLNSTNQIPKSNEKAAASYAKLAAKLTAMYVTIRRVSTVVASWIYKSNEYIENLNLFTVAMGEYATEAKEYAETVGELMGIDPGEWMRNQGVFMTLATGFGVVNDRAYTMSKNLTQLGYDLSSFFNITFEDSMQKLQSGISGELEPLRRLGYDLSQAKLEATALSLGIDKAVSSMTQAEKAELRYYAIMTQVTTAQGDMARTLTAPANQIRVLKAQITQAARALGNIFIPALNAVLPYAIALAKIVRELASSIAALFGFSLPEVDYSGIEAVGGSASDASDAIDDTTGSVKELKKSLLGIDELNLLTDNSNSGGSGVDVSGGGGGFDFELPEYTFLDDIEDSVGKIHKKLKKLLKPVGKILEALWEYKELVAAGLAVVALGKLWTVITNWWSAFKALKLVDAFLTGFSLIKVTGGNVLQSIVGGIDNVRMNLTGMQKAAITAVAGFIEFAVIRENINELAKGCENAGAKIVEIGVVATAAAAAMYVALGPGGLAIAAIVAITGAVVGFGEAQSELRKELVDAEFFDGVGIALDTFRTKLELLTEKFNLQNKQICDWREEIEANNETIDKIGSKIQTLTATLGSTGTVTQEEIDKIKGQFDSLYECVQENMTLSEEVILTALVGAMQRATPEIAEQIDLMIGEYQRYVRETQGRAEELKGLIDGAYDDLLGKSKDDPAYQEIMGNITKWYEELGYLSGSMSDAGWQWQQTVTDFNNNEIDFGDDVETATEKLGEIATCGQTALEDLATARDTILKQIDESIAYAARYGSLEQVEMLGDIRQSIEDDYAAQEEAIKSELNTIFESIQEGMISEISGTKDRLEDEWDNMGWFERWWNDHDEEKYVRQGLQDMQGHIDTISKAIQGHMDDLETNGSAWADDAMQGIIDALFESKITRSDLTGSTLHYSYAMDLEDAIEQVFSELEESGKKASTTAGEEITNGLGSGISSEAAVDAVTGAAVDVVDAADQAVRDAADINSPSKLFATEGGHMMDGLIKGIKDKLSALKDTLTSVVRSAFDTDKAWDYGYDYGWSFAKGLVKAIKNTSFPTIKGTVTTSGSSASISFQAYADGGFPDMGQMFVAREAGPELVGTIGNRTAVVNNDQIVASVSQGVYEANSEQNALLREQNNLLRKLLEKDTDVTAVVGTGDVISGFERKNRRDGRTVVPVGV